jgi:hypothetical protein
MRRLSSSLAVAVLTLAFVATTPAGAGSGWSITPTPNPAGAPASTLSALACRTVHSCVAVGTYYTASNKALSLAEGWDGSNWTILPTQNPAGAQTPLSGVSCPAANDCIAVGYMVTSNSVHGLVEHWNGKVWKIVPSPLPPGVSYGGFQAISCTAPNACIAVGYFLKNSVTAQTQPLSERWDGTAWTVLPTPNPHAENGSFLTSVACGGASACEAIGNYIYADVDSSIFAFGWNGTTWARQNQPNPGGQNNNSDNAVSCSGPAACDAVGTWNDANGNILPLAESWNGAKWTRQRTPAPAGAQLTDLYGVSCPAAVGCWAVGDSSNTLNGLPSATLAEQWNGADWDIVPTPNPAGAQGSTLKAVDCPSAGACMAVGSSYAAGITKTLAEIYTG